MRTASSLLLAAFACRAPTKDTDTDTETDTIACEGGASGGCGDGVDNDRAGYFDCEDDGCWNSPDCEDGGGDSSGGGDTEGDIEPLAGPADQGQWYMTPLATSVSGGDVSHPDPETTSMEGIIPLTLQHAFTVSFTED